MWFMLFIKQLPVIAIAEVKEIVPPRLRKPHPHGIDSSGRHFEYEPDTPGEFA
jgi:molybdopterin-containing oxidoreductase family membrane subunit